MYKMPRFVPATDLNTILKSVKVGPWKNKIIKIKKFLQNPGLSLKL